MDRWELRRPAPELVERYLAEGWWTDKTLGEQLDDYLDAAGDRDFRIWSATRPYRSTLRDVHVAARRFAASLADHGVGPGDVVAFQLPNCVEAAIVFWGTTIAGATLVPIVHFYGPKEVGYILGQSRPKVFVTADRFGAIDYLATVATSTAVDPDLELLAIVAMGDEPAPAGPGVVPFESLVADQVEPVAEPVHVDPDAPALIAYTSGTTADPKGVIHSHRTIGAEVVQLGDTQPVGAKPNLTGAPVGHAIGMLAGLLMPPYRGDPIHLADVWNPPAILAAMVEGDLSSGSGATFFLTSLLDCPDFGDEHLARMRFVGLGGSSVPEAVADRAIGMGISVVRAYGSTEHPSTSGALHTTPQDDRKRSDGQLLPGVEVRLVDDDGVEVARGEPGEILSRGPDLFVGYTDPALTTEAVDADGWYHSGDIGILDEGGWLTITDRKKDIIIRGGENISAAEVEDELLRLPGVAEAAVVAAPDERLGEHACAFLRMVPGTEVPTLVEVRDHLAGAGLAKQKWPEELRAADDFPRTPSGKVKKHVLRTQLRDEAAQPAG